MGSIMYRSSADWFDDGIWDMKTFTSTDELIPFIESMIGKKITKFVLDEDGYFTINKPHISFIQQHWNFSFVFAVHISPISQYSDTKAQEKIYTNLYKEILTEYCYGLDSEMYNKNIL